jgi:hypothetical protein
MLVCRVSCRAIGRSIQASRSDAIAGVRPGHREAVLGGRVGAPSR